MRPAACVLVHDSLCRCQLIIISSFLVEQDHSGIFTLYPAAPYFLSSKRKRPAAGVSGSSIFPPMPNRFTTPVPRVCDECFHVNHHVSVFMSIISQRHQLEIQPMPAKLPPAKDPDTGLSSNSDLVACRARAHSVVRSNRLYRTVSRSVCIFRPSSGSPVAASRPAQI